MKCSKQESCDPKNLGMEVAESRKSHGSAAASRRRIFHVYASFEGVPVMLQAIWLEEDSDTCRGGDLA